MYRWAGASTRRMPEALGISGPSMPRYSPSAPLFPLDLLVRRPAPHGLRASFPCLLLSLQSTCHSGLPSRRPSSRGYSAYGPMMIVRGDASYKLRPRFRPCTISSLSEGSVLGLYGAKEE